MCGCLRSLNDSAAPAACRHWVEIGTQNGKSLRASLSRSKSLPRSSPPQYISTSRGFTPRMNMAPYSR